jgi:hypothetical protein
MMVLPADRRFKGMRLSMARVWVWSLSFHKCGPRTRAHLNGQSHFTAHVARMGADHATSGAVRATKDVDFLVSAEAS